MTTAYLTCLRGRVTAESVIVVDGVEWPLTHPRYGSVDFRVRDTLRRAGYRLASSSFDDCHSEMDDSGGYTIEVEQL